MVKSDTPNTGVADKTMNTDPMPNDDIIEIDLSQDDDSFGPTEPNGEANTSAAVQKPNTHPKKKNAKSMGAPSVPSTSPRPKRSQSTTPISSFDKRQRRRSIGVRHKVSEIVEQKKLCA